MAGFVPIHILNEKQSFGAVLIDDDELIRTLWSNAANKAGKELLTFAHPDQFFAEVGKLSRQSAVYVDANLGLAMGGEEIAAQIHALGFDRVYLATGYEPEKFEGLSFLCGIIGKSPPNWL